MRITNPNGSGKTLYIHSIYSEVDPGNNNFCRFKYYTNSTGVSVGTAITPRNLYTGSANSSVATVTSLPTVTGFGNLIAKRLAPAGNTLGSTTLGEKLNNYWILPPNTTMTITGSAKANGTPVSVEIMWFEI